MNGAKAINQYGNLICEMQSATFCIQYRKMGKKAKEDESVPCWLGCIFCILWLAIAIFVGIGTVFGNTFVSIISTEGLNEKFENWSNL